MTAPTFVAFVVALDALLDLVKVNWNLAVFVVAPSREPDRGTSASVVATVRCQPNDSDVRVTEECLRFYDSHHGDVEVLCPTGEEKRAE